MRVVYVDTLFFLNLAVDYFLLVLTVKVAGVYIKRSRLLASALVGALLAVLLYFPPLPKTLALVLRLAVCCVTALAAFIGEPGKSWPRLLGIFVMVTLLLAGIVLGLSELGGGAHMQNGVLYFEISGTVMVLSFTAVYVLSGLVLGKGRASPGRSYQEVTAEMGERSVRFRALTDSGNLLRDPMSGRKVIVVESRAIAPLFGGMTGELLQSLDALAPETALEQLRRCGNTPFWLLPARTAAQNALMVVFRPEKLYIDGNLREDYILGLAGRQLEIGGDCRALMGV